MEISWYAVFLSCTMSANTPVLHPVPMEFGVQSVQPAGSRTRPHLLVTLTRDDPRIPTLILSFPRHRRFPCGSLGNRQRRRLPDHTSATSISGLPSLAMTSMKLMSSMRGIKLSELIRLHSLVLNNKFAKWSFIG
ncbi:hypothetical protein BC629DRAFT_1557717 [Irpex lacteus]|nr:hypothetical protein BC629DRAFT_1557717 [Irpex lacteus]